MPKVLKEEEMGNFEVLKWMRETKKRHAKEDREAEAAGLVLPPRPSNFKRAVEKHERHLTRDVYPYEKNKSVHNEKYDVDAVCEKFNIVFVERICGPIREKYREKLKAGEITKKEAQQKVDEENEPKILSEMELMQLHNLAPTGMEALQLIIEQWEERFTETEMQQILDVVMEVLRPDELAAKQETEDVATTGAEEKTGLGETAKMEKALREVSPYTARAEMTSGPVTDLPHHLAPAAGKWPAGWVVSESSTGSNAAEMPFDRLASKGKGDDE